MIFMSQVIQIGRKCIYPIGFFLNGQLNINNILILRKNIEKI